MSFSLLKTKKSYSFFVNHPEYTYFDTGSTAICPTVVVDAITSYYKNYNVSLNHILVPPGNNLKQQIQVTRTNIKSFINAPRASNIIFTSGATYGLNYICQTLRFNLHLKTRHNLVLTSLAHASLVGSFMQLKQETNCSVRVAQLNQTNFQNSKELLKLVDQNTFLVGVTNMDNTFGFFDSSLPVIIQKIRQIAPQVIIICDVTQAIAHYSIDVQALDADFVVFSGHKIFGPTGIGVMFWKSYWLYNLKPLFWGGGTINHIFYRPDQALTFNNKIMLADPPALFEPGTQNLSGILGLNQAVKLWLEMDYQQLHTHEQNLKKLFFQLLKSITKKHLLFYNKTLNNCFIIFKVKNGDSHDCIAYLAQKFKIIIRTGDVCAKLLLPILNIHSFLRITIAPYNDACDIEKIAFALNQYITERFKNNSDEKFIFSSSDEQHILTDKERALLLNESQQLFHKIAGISVVNNRIKSRSNSLFLTPKEYNFLLNASRQLLVKNKQTSDFNDDFAYQMVNYSNPLCGDHFVLYFYFNQTKSKLIDWYFKSSGCVLSETATSIFLKFLQTWTVQDIKATLKDYYDSLQTGKVVPHHILPYELRVLCKMKKHKSRLNCLLVPYHLITMIFQKQK